MLIKKIITRLFITLVGILAAVLISNCSRTEKKDMTPEFTEFLKTYEAKVIPLSKDLNLAYFNATTSGDQKMYQKMEELQIQMSKIFADKNDFALLKKIKESGTVTDPVLARQLELIYNAYLAKQIDEKKLEKMIQMQTEVEQKYSTFRAEVNGEKLTDNQIEEILKSSTDSNKLKKTWMASKQIGAVVKDEVLQLVKMRNEAARELGFRNYHAMQLELSEQNPDSIEQLFNELDQLTRTTFINLKSDIDRFLAKRYNISQADLMPWHYQNRFFQEAPKIYTVDLDKYYKNKNIVDLTRKYYDGIGLNIDGMVEKSDLYEREGKYQHAYCTDIDRQGDVRVVGNIKPNYNWMNTMLHEFGHAVYDEYHDRSLPWTLREPAHTFTTEAIAMMFGRFASNPVWLKDVVGISQKDEQVISADCFKSLRLEQLVFSRWAQVMYRFEKSMYENPDQDLNKLWWDLVEKYQMIKRPEDRNEPDWVSKIHVALYPAYYHNYLMGELLASQIYYYIAEKVIKTTDIKNQSFANHKEVGTFLIEKVFKPGSLYYWNDMIKKATGEKLSAKYYARQFVN